MLTSRNWPCREERAGRLAAVDAHGTFGKLVGDLDYTIFIVTARASGQQVGCLIGFCTQSSIDPPRFLVCPSRKNHAYRLANSADLLAVHFVPRQAKSLAELVGEHSGNDVDKSHSKFHCAGNIAPGHPT
jgi:flavin reductase (DIM6/NTAB) family NADH-FMN oxidoreductase RutF